tara:strand:+ start:13623 stop:13850 length:228 start_codon:yes stop_codon:yes gene_type:complete
MQKQIRLSEAGLKKLPANKPIDVGIRDPISGKPVAGSVCKECEKQKQQRKLAEKDARNAWAECARLQAQLNREKE